ncbi:MAG: hypothetical protein H7318_14800, partial [Oligoflexus sp.]|nr:hypothetical protein [Oligoflexus sp.]
MQRSLLSTLFSIASLFMIQEISYAQESLPFAQCDTDVSRDQLNKFDQQLRDAVTKNSFADFTSLFGNKVRFNYKDRSSKIDKKDAQSLSVHKDFIFTEEFRKAISDDKKPDCVGYRGLMYADGKLWVNAFETIGISAINAENNGPKGEISAIEPVKIFDCKTGKHHVIVDLIDQENYRYRSWSISKVRTKPDLEILKGKLLTESHGSCSRQKFSFKNSNTIYTIKSSCAAKDKN